MSRTAWNWQGCSQHEYVRVGTKLACSSAALVLLLWCRGHVWSLENPANSQLEHAAPMQYLIRWFLERTSMGYEAATMHQFRISLGDFGAPTLKGVWFYASEDLSEPLTAPQRFSQRKHPNHAPQVTITCLGMQSLLCMPCVPCSYMYTYLNGGTGMWTPKDNSDAAAGPTSRPPRNTRRSPNPGNRAESISSSLLESAMLMTDSGWVLGWRHGGDSTEIV